jgi:hypothetical protein
MADIKPKIQEAKKSLGRELLEAERAFQQGTTSLKDLIAPSAMSIDPGYMQVSGKFARSVFVFQLAGTDYQFGCSHGYFYVYLSD